MRLHEDTVTVSFRDSIRMLERGFEQAHDRAIGRYGIDESGHSDRIPEWDRSSCSIQLELDMIRSDWSMGGMSVSLVFKIWIEKMEDEDE